jgi:hypothetical protein
VFRLPDKTISSTNPNWDQSGGGRRCVSYRFALTRIPSSLSAATSFERGLGAENRSDFSAAEREYQKSLLMFSRSDLVHGRLFVAAFKAGDKAVAREEYDFLENRPLDAHIAREINSILGREN